MECLGGTRLQIFFTLFTRATPGTPASICIFFEILKIFFEISKHLPLPQHLPLSPIITISDHAPAAELKNFYFNSTVDTSTPVLE